MNFRAAYNWRAMAALAAGAGLGLHRMVLPSLRVLYDYAWFVGFGMSFNLVLATDAAPATTSHPRSEDPGYNRFL